MKNEGIVRVRTGSVMMLHTVAVAAGVGLAHAARDGDRRVPVREARLSGEAGLRMRRRRKSGPAVARSALQHVALDRVSLHTVQRGTGVEALSQDALALQRVWTSVVAVRESTRVHGRVRRSADADAGVAKCEVRDGLLAVIRATGVSIELLALELVLDTLAVGRVTDERQDRADTLNEQCPLVGLSVVERSLHTVVAVRVTEQLLQTCTVEQFADEHLPRGVFRDADALCIVLTVSVVRDQRTSRPRRTFSITFELNFCTERAQTLPVN